MGDYKPSEAHNRAVAKYANAHYTQLAVRVPNDMADRFKQILDDNGESMRSVLMRYIQEYIDENAGI